jgi:pyruvate dehydrogenase E1 component alpha subunit
MACLAVSRWALDHARSGQGPVLVEAFTYRMGAHTTSDDPTRYRISDEVEEWKLKDPIARVKAYLTREGWADAEFFEAVEAESEQLARRVREGVRTMPDPDPVSIFEHVYAEENALVDEERREYVAYAASFEGEGEDL